MTKIQHYHRDSLSLRYVLLYIRFGFERNGVERGGSLHPYKTPHHPLPHFIPHTIIYLLQKNKNYTYCLIYLYLVLQTLPSHLSNKKTALTSQNYAIFSTISTITWHYVLTKKYVVTKKLAQKKERVAKKHLINVGCLQKKAPGHPILS